MSPAASAAAVGSDAAACPGVTETADFAGVRQLRDWNRVQDRLGFRPTGHRNHVRYVNWLERRFESIPGVRVSSIRHRFRRWEARSASLRVTIGGRERRLRPAGPVPYSRPTSAAGTEAPLVHLPAGTDINAANSAGRIVVRDLVAGQLQNRLFELVTWSVFDPRGTLDPDGIYKRDWLSGQASADMRAAGSAGAAGVLFVHELPRAQIAGHYRPYDGVHWNVPALHLGVDEGEEIKRAIAAGTAGAARLSLSARTFERAPTRSLLARLGGPGRRRIVVNTHTDGVNALWDNGPVPMLAIAEYVARLPRRCRPGPMEFVLNTGHLYQSLDAGAHAYAGRLDRAYDRGSVALVLSLEHLGAREWEAVPRGGGRPGLTLRRTAQSEPSTTFVTESDFLVETLTRIVRRRRVERSLLLQGTAPADDSHVPPFCSFGGEGTPYLQHLIPTVAFISAPWTLFNPAYGLEQLDFGLMRAQTLTFTDFLLKLRGVPQRRIAGKYARYREERRAGKPRCE